MLKILIVDDDPAILDAMEVALNLEGYEVESTTKGEETFSKIDSFSPDLVLIDVYLAGMDGRDICQKIKAKEKTSKLPVVIFSADKSMKQVFKECKADDFIGKPFKMDEMYEKIKNQTSHILY